MSSFHVLAGSGNRIVHPNVRIIRFSDLGEALRRGLDDFMAKPSHVVFLCIIYPLIGVFLAAWTSGGGALHLLFPLMSGFALLGPIAAIGLYEISRRREAGLDTSWRHALEVRHSPAIPSILAVGGFLLAVFIVWLLVAQGIYQWLIGPVAPASLGEIAALAFGTSAGHALIIIGNLVGLCFALVVLCTTVVAFPLLLDRDVGAYEAMATSMRVFAANPLPIMAWGAIVAALLTLGSLPLFAGLAIVLPVLGHSTWHLYRKTVEAPRS